MEVQGGGGESAVKRSPEVARESPFGSRGLWGELGEANDQLPTRVWRGVDGGFGKIALDETFEFGETETETSTGLTSREVEVPNLVEGGMGDTGTIVLDGPDDVLMILGEGPIDRITGMAGIDGISGGDRGHLFEVIGIAHDGKGS